MNSAGYDEQMSQSQSDPIKIICVYPQVDEQYYLELKKYLILWERQDNITWLETQPGDDTIRTMEEFLKQASLIILLLSADFFVADGCYHGMQIALQEQAKRHVLIAPILARPVDWQHSACKDLKVLPYDERPIIKWTLQEDAYENIRASLARLMPQVTKGLPISTCPRLFEPRNLPAGYVPRMKAFKLAKDFLLEKHYNPTAAITVGLRGVGGFGKTTLALALCHDPDIQLAFPDGILWLELGEQPPRALDLLNSVLNSLEGSHPRAITLEEARSRWNKTLNERICLLVIDDVWQATALVQPRRNNPGVYGDVGGPLYVQ